MTFFRHQAHRAIQPETSKRRCRRSLIITDNGGKLVGAWFTQGDYDMISIIQAEDDKAKGTISARLAVKDSTRARHSLRCRSTTAKASETGREVAMFLETERAGATTSAAPCYHATRQTAACQALPNLPTSSLPTSGGCDRSACRP